MNNHIQLVLKSSTTEMSLNDHESGIYIVPELEGLTGLPEIRTTSGVNSGYDGGWTSAQNFDARSITIRGVIANTDVATVERMRKQLVALLAQGKNETLTLNLVTEAGNSYDVEVRTIACEMAMQTVLQQQEFLIQLRADDPLIYDSSAGGGSALVQVQHAIGGFEINFELPLAISGGEGESVIQNNGLEQVYPIIKMYGALHRPTFVNLTTNQQIQLDTTLAYAEGSWFNPSETYTGQMIYLEDAPDNAPLASFQLDGETSQNGTPTPSAPVPVQTVTGENVVKICRKNLFDKDNAGNIINAYIDSDHTIITFNANNRLIYVPCAPNTNYAIQKIARNNIRQVAYTKELPTIGVQTYSMTNIQNWSTQTYTTGADARYIVLRLWVSNQDTTTLEQMLASVQIELGSTATTYEPYQGQSYEVNLGKNLFDKDNSSGLFQGYISGGKAWASSGYWSYYIPCKPNTTYTASRTIIGNGGRFAIATSQTVPGNNLGVAQLAQDNTATTLTITTNSSAKYIIVWFANVNDAGSESLADWEAVQQIEKGSQATSYAAYFAPIELCKIGDYQDYIYKSGGKWYVRKEVGKTTLSSSSNWYHNSYAHGFSVQFSADRLFSAYAGICTHAEVQTSSDTWTGVGKCGWNTTNTFWFEDGGDVATSDEEFKTWLDSNIVNVYYVLATPTDTEITNEALIEQLETLLTTARTYAGTNNIFTVTQNEQGTLEISYYTDKEADRRDVVIIDSRMRTVTLNGIDIYHLIEEGSEFPMLDPGENKLVLRSDIPGDNGYAEVNYKQGYLSI